MQFTWNLEAGFNYWYNLKCVQILFRLGVGGGGKMNWRIRLTSAKIGVGVEVEAELGNITQILQKYYRNISKYCPSIVQNNVHILFQYFIYIVMILSNYSKKKFKILFQYNPYVLQLKSRHYVHCLSIVWICPNIVQILPK